MENPKNDAQIERQIVSSDLVSGKEMLSFEKQYVLNTAIKYASTLVKKKSDEISGYDTKGEEVKNHLNVVVLDRIISLRPTGSTTEKFTALKQSVCDSLGILEVELLTDERLYTVLASELDKYFDEELPQDVNRNMDFIRRATDGIIPS